MRKNKYEFIIRRLKPSGFYELVVFVNDNFLERKYADSISGIRLLKQAYRRVKL